MWAISYGCSTIALGSPLKKLHGGRHLPRKYILGLWKNVRWGQQKKYVGGEAGEIFHPPKDLKRNSLNIITLSK